MNFSKLLPYVIWQIKAGMLVFDGENPISHVEASKLGKRCYLYDLRFIIIYLPNELFPLRKKR